MLSCDNLPDNGVVLQRALVAFAAASDADLARWIEAEVACPRTMVDSITPATDDALRARAEKITGVLDEWPIQREPFTQWVVEDVPVMRDADWQSVGVTLAKDVGVYDRAKLRLLNGPHSTLAYLGLLRGHESVADAMRDEQLAQFVELLMTEDLAPSLGAIPRASTSSTTSPRCWRDFAIPGITAPVEPDRLGRLEEAARALVVTIGEALRAGRPVHRLVMPLAAWMRFIVRQAKAGRSHRRSGRRAPCEHRRGLHRRCARRSADRFAVCEAVLPPALLSDERFRKELETAYDRLGAPQTALTSELSS